MEMGVNLVIIYMMMLLGPWVLLCLGIMGLVLISFGKKKARWVINIFGSWLATDKVYRELAYELYNLEPDCHEYEGIHKGSNGEIVISFKENFGETMVQRDYIAIGLGIYSGFNIKKMVFDNFRMYCLLCVI